MRKEGRLGDVATGEDFTAKLMNDMDPALLDLIQSKVTSFVKWDLVRFFYENPNTMDSAENIARYVGRNVGSVVPELDELAEDGVMDKRIVGQILTYSLAEDNEMRQLIERFILACEDRHFRVKAVYHIIKGMR